MPPFLSVNYFNDLEAASAIKSQNAEDSKETFLENTETPILYLGDDYSDWAKIDFYKGQDDFSLPILDPTKE